jgi:lysylphosphatidylglycerol synthetase-like protein (DUF2156 family)
MKRYLGSLEKYLGDNVFNNFSQLPDYIENPLIKYLPLISFIFGLLCLLSAYGLWNSAHTASSLVTYGNQYGALYGVPRVSTSSNMNLAFWLAIICMVSEAFLFFRAVPTLTKKLKAGWSLAYYALVLNIVYGAVMLFSNYGGSVTLIERILFSFVSFYFLFEVREVYTNKVTQPKKHRKP